MALQRSLCRRKVIACLAVCVALTIASVGVQWTKGSALPPALTNHMHSDVTLLADTRANRTQDIPSPVEDDEWWPIGGEARIRRAFAVIFSDTKDTLVLERALALWNSLQAVKDAEDLIIALVPENGAYELREPLRSMGYRVLARASPAPAWRASGRFVQQALGALNSDADGRWSPLTLEALSWELFEEVVVLDQKVILFPTGKCRHPSANATGTDARLGVHGVNSTSASEKNAPTLGSTQADETSCSFLSQLTDDDHWTLGFAPDDGSSLAEGEGLEELRGDLRKATAQRHSGLMVVRPDARAYEAVANVLCKGNEMMEEAFPDLPQNPLALVEVLERRASTFPLVHLAVAFAAGSVRSAELPLRICGRGSNGEASGGDAGHDRSSRRPGIVWCPSAGRGVESPGTPTRRLTGSLTVIDDARDRELPRGAPVRRVGRAPARVGSGGGRDKTRYVSAIDAFVSLAEDLDMGAARDGGLEIDGHGRSQPAAGYHAGEQGAPTPLRGRFGLSWRSPRSTRGHRGSGGTPAEDFLGGGGQERQAVVQASWAHPTVDGQAPGRGKRSSSRLLEASAHDSGQPESEPDADDAQGTADGVNVAWIPGDPCACTSTPGKLGEACRGWLEARALQTTEDPLSVCEGEVFKMPRAVPPVQGKDALRNLQRYTVTAGAPPVQRSDSPGRKGGDEGQEDEASGSPRPIWQERPTTKAIVTERDLKSFRHFWLADEKHKILMLAIPKVACTQLHALFLRMRGSQGWNSPNLIQIHFHADQKKITMSTMTGMTPEKATSIMNDPTWTRGLFLRDPVDRLLSCYLDKIVHRKSYSLKILRAHEVLSFEGFVGFLSKDAPRRFGGASHNPQLGLSPLSNPHWRPQYYFNLDKFLPYFDFIGDFSHVEAHSRELLQKAGIWEEFGASGWGPTGKNALFQRSTVQGHATGSHDSKSMYYSTALLASVRESYGPTDYSMFSKLGWWNESLVA